jgi:hypothetical protein
MIATYDTFTVDRISLTLRSLIVAGIIFRVIYCAVKLMTADEEALQYKKRLKHAIMFAVFAILAESLKNLILTYYA